MNLYLCREYISGTPRQKYGFDFNVSDMIQDGPNKDIRIVSIPVRNGDVIQQGRSGSFIRHSYNSTNKSGILELGIKDKILYTIDNMTASIGDILTKTLHVVNSKITDLFKLNKIDIVLNTDIASEPVVNEITDETEKNVILNQTDEIYNISNLNDSEKVLYRQVLGEKQNMLLNNIILSLQQILKNNYDVMTLLKNHTHVFTEYTDNKVYTIDLGDAGVRNITVDTTIPEREVKELVDTDKTIDTVTLNIFNINNKTFEMIDKLKDNLSKHQFLN